MADLKGSQTHENLRRLFSEEAQTGGLYRYFSRIAEFEGYSEFAALFSTMAEAQALFADGHLDFLRTVSDPTTGMPLGETESNLASALESERVASDSAYPAMAKTAHSEGFPAIASWFETLALSRKAHYARFSDAVLAAKDIER